MCNKKKRGPKKKEGFRQELRITPIVEEVFSKLKINYNFKTNSEALHKMAELLIITDTKIIQK